MEELQEIKCPICFNRYNEDFYFPTLLRCAHTICSHCYHEIKPSTCPICRGTVTYQKSSVNKNQALLEVVRKYLVFGECREHKNMPLKYLCVEKNQQLCEKCLQTKEYKGIETQDIEPIKREIKKKAGMLEEWNNVWDQYQKKFSSILEKRKNIQLDSVDKLFDKLEATVKKRRLDIRNEIILAYEHEQYRVKANLTSSNKAVALRDKKWDYNREDPKFMWDFFNENIEQLSLQLDTKEAEDNFQNVCNKLEISNKTLITQLEENQQSLASIDFLDSTIGPTSDQPPKEDDISLKSLVFTVESLLVFELKDGVLFTGYDVKSPCKVEIPAWKDVRRIDFSYAKMWFAKNDLEVLDFVFSRLTQIESIKLDQSVYYHEDDIDDESEIYKKSLIRFLGIIFLKQQHLTSIDLNFMNDDSQGLAILKSFISHIFPNLKNRPVRSIALHLQYSENLGKTLREFIDSISILRDSLESVILDIPQVISQYCLEEHALYLPKLKNFVLQLDCGLNENYNNKDLECFITSSIKDMHYLESLDIRLFNCEFNKKWFKKVVMSIEYRLTLKKVSIVVTSKKHCTFASSVNVKESSGEDLKEFYSRIQPFKETLSRMAQLSAVFIRFEQVHCQLQGREEIECFIDDYDKYMNSDII